mgnify:CR=1 FL=1
MSFKFRPLTTAAAAVCIAVALAGCGNKQSAQQIRQLERDEKGIGKHPRTEYPRYHEIADEAENAREQCHTADGGKCFKQIHL